MATVNLNLCREGQFVETINNRIGMYLGSNNPYSPCYPHIVEFSTHYTITYTNQGFYLSHPGPPNSHNPHSLDIAIIHPYNEQKHQEWIMRKNIEEIWGGTLE